MSNILQDLDRIKGRISDPSFLNNKGLSNEVGIHVFCYAADETLDISNTGNVILRDDTYRNSYQKGAIFYQRHKLIYATLYRLQRILQNIYIFILYSLYGLQTLTPSMTSSSASSCIISNLYFRSIWT